MFSKVYACIQKDRFSVTTSNLDFVGGIAGMFGIAFEGCVLSPFTKAESPAGQAMRRNQTGRWTAIRSLQPERAGIGSNAKFKDIALLTK